MVSLTPAAFAAATMASASARVVAIGFSQRMCLPAWAAAITGSAWAAAQVVTLTISTSGLATQVLEVLVGDRVAVAELRGRGLGAVEIDVADGDEACRGLRWMLLQVGVAGDAAAADHADANLAR